MPRRNLFRVHEPHERAAGFHSRRLGLGVEQVGDGLRLVGLLARPISLSREHRDPPLLLPRPVDGDGDEPDEKDRKRPSFSVRTNANSHPNSTDRQPDQPDEESHIAHRIVISADISTTRGTHAWTGGCRCD